MATRVNAGGTATFTLITAPTKGILKNNGTLINTNDTFTQADINANKITYVPNPNASGSDSFPFSVSDGTEAVNGQFNIAITSVNDAPTMTHITDVTLTGTDENTTSTATAVSNILTGAGYADADAGALSGIAVFASTGNGTWQYSTDSITWTNLGSVSAGASVLLSSESYVRYIPNGINGETAILTFRGGIKHQVCL